MRWIALTIVSLGLLGADYSWLEGQPAAETLAGRVPLRQGFRRLAADEGSFGAWLRGLPVRPGRPVVRLHDGSRKFNQLAHYLVLEIDVGPRDLQQCADAVMRLRAEYLYARGCGDAIGFDFTSGDRARWSEWRAGARPQVRGNDVSWTRSASPDSSYASFRRYLESVFTYAGSASLAQELESVEHPSRVEIGDVFIQGGFPGHAVLVVDVAVDGNGERAFLLAQSYMPAQDIHVLRNPVLWQSPWYRAKDTGMLLTPEWRFRHEDLRRFAPARNCPPPQPTTKDVEAPSAQEPPPPSEEDAVPPTEPPRRERVGSS